MTFPIAHTGVTLTELPGKIAVYFAFGNCQNHCDGCHSPELTYPVENPLTNAFMKGYAAEQINKGANAILLMGGTTNGIAVDDLIYLINSLDTLAPVGIYSGSNDDALHQHIADRSRLTWLKTGSYQKEKGGLDNPLTNQRFYRKEIVYQIRGPFDITPTTHLIDKTHLFQKKTKG